MKRLIYLFTTLILFLLCANTLMAQEDTCVIQEIETSYFEDFSSYSTNSFPDCWTRSSTNVSIGNINWSGSKELKFTSANGDSVIAIMPMISTGYPMSHYKLSFNWKNTSQGNGAPGLFIIGVVSETSDLETFTPVDTVAANNYTSHGAWATKSVNFLNYDEGGAFIAFKFVMGDVSQSFVIDDLLIEELGEIETCSEVATIHLGNVTSSTMELSWTPGEIGTPESYRIEWVEEITGTAGYDFTDTTTYEITSLNERTGYAITVSVDCGDGDYTDGKTVDFRTRCMAENGVIVGAGTDKRSVIPVNLSSRYSYSQQLYTHTELGGEEMDITGIAFQYTGSLETKRNITVYLGYTTADAFASTSAWLPLSELKKVYEGDMTFRSGATDNWAVINLDSVFQYNGTSNIVVAIDDNTGAPQSSATSQTFLTHTISDLLTLDVDDYYQTTPNNYDPASPPNDPETAKYRNNIKFISCDTESSVCSEPAYTIAGTGETSATLTITNPGSANAWEAEMRLYGEADWSPLDDIYDLVTFISDLEPSSYYEIRVKAVCGEDFESGWITNTFYTSCTEIGVPYERNFDSDPTGSVPYCWTGFPAADNRPIVSSQNSAFSSGPNSLRMRSTFYTPGHVVLPKMDSTYDISSLYVKFKMHVNRSLNLEVGVMSSATDTESFTTLYTVTPQTTDSWQNVTAYLNKHDADTNGRFIAFRWQSGGETSYLNHCYIDDVEIDFASPCIPPTNVSLADVQLTSAVFTWDGGENTDWVVRYAEVGSAVDTVYAVSTPCDTLQNLKPATNYVFYVYTECDGIQSEWAGPYEFTTSCHSIATLPYTEGFDSSTYIPVCWSTPETFTSWGVTYPQITTAQSKSPWQSVEFAGSAGSATRATLVSPQIDADIAMLSVSFALRCESVQAGFIQVGVMSDPSNLSTFEMIKEVSVTPGGGWKRVTVALDEAEAVSGAGNHIALRHRALASGYSYFIDDITIDTIRRYTILATASTGGSVTPDSIAVFGGENATFTMLTEDGYYMSDLLIDGESIDTTSSYTFTNVQKNHTLEARFELIPIIIVDPCDAPTTIQVTPLVDTATVTWTMTENAIGWKIRYKKAAGSEWITIECESDCNQTTYTLTELDSATTYALQMASLCEDSTSLWSSEVYFTTNSPIIIEDGISPVLSLNNRIELYPNPGKDLVFVRITGDDIDVQNIVVYDSYGRACKAETVNSNNITIDVSHLAPGLYFVHFNCGKQAAVKKIVVE
ncbi:fibronectin type III domain-containing protein [Bacteroidales bacterium OttesenSCG-928-B11]|nr:fibronectin type III domain-containing protein [Bacteroidales bacterium OttesenSCG-928-C03]MDL2312140.1 fibronectin type III domain-containing protein [Bacteroidales bacterium OttesenSCG-928-B11]